MQQDNSATNAILVVLLVIVVGVAVWFIADRRGPAVSEPDGANIQVDLGGNGNDTGTGGGDDN